MFWLQMNSLSMRKFIFPNNEAEEVRQELSIIYYAVDF